MNWQAAQGDIDTISGEAEMWIERLGKDIDNYKKHVNDLEILHQLLVNINRYAFELGVLHAKSLYWKERCEKGYDIEKAKAKVTIIRNEKQTVGYAEAAKYEHVAQFTDTLAEAIATNAKAQNARASARDTAEAIRSRISSLKGSLRG